MNIFIVFLTDYYLFTAILKKTWHVYSVSVLFNCILDDEVKLNKYGKKLREMLAQRLPKEDCSYSANFRILEDLIAPNFKDSPGPLQVLFNINLKRLKII